jgi:ADP-dependent NAD(P)H-hydrate dehydratase / NAD(P)H-hydrate epimerase
LTLDAGSNIIGLMKILTAAQMREVDRLTTAQYAVPGLLLMETAAARAIAAVENKFGLVEGKRALIICGRGNNGGDGAAIARLLLLKHASVDLLLLGRLKDASGDARINFEIARAISDTRNSRLRFIEIETAAALTEHASSEAYDFFFDAILGTGLSRPASGLFEEAIRAINEASRDSHVIAIDIPSGLASDSAELIGPAVRARLTITFTAPKAANILPPASDCNGELIIAQIGSPVELIDSSGSFLNLIEASTVERWLRSSRRASDANKGDAGKALIVAGSRGKTGAACLVGEAAMRAGAGLVTVATPESSQPVIASRLIVECMTEPLEETSSGSVAREAADRVLELAAARDVVAMGPGLGSSEEATRDFVRSVVSRLQQPVILDADALNALAPWDESVRASSPFPLILTPHPGEMARLVSKPIADVVRNRVDIARAFAADHGVILVLKGSRTVIASPDGQVYINPTGNSGMATGGTGDVLTGIIAGLLAQKRDDPLAAVIAGVYLHGLAGDIAAASTGTRALIASDISAHLSDAFIRVGGEKERG